MSLVTIRNKNTCEKLLINLDTDHMQHVANKIGDHRSDAYQFEIDQPAEVLCFNLDLFPGQRLTYKELNANGWYDYGL